LFEENQSLNDLKIFSDKNKNLILSPYGQIVFLMMTGQKEKGEQFIKEQYITALTPQTSSQTINYPDGRSEVKISKPYINQQYVDSIERLAKHFGCKL